WRRELTVGAGGRLLTLWLPAVALGAIATVAAFLDLWFYLVITLAGIAFVLFAMHDPFKALLVALLLSPELSPYARISLPAGLPDLTFNRVTIGSIVVVLLLQVMIKGRRLPEPGAVER